MQFLGKVKPPVGIIFDSDMGTRIDNALALALLYGLDGKNEARVVGLSVTRSSLAAAQFCDIVGRFYASNTTGPRAKYMRGLTIGLATNTRLTGDTPMLTGPLARKAADGSPVYPPNIGTLNDTAEPAVIIRNTLMAQYDQNAIVVLAGPATNLAATLDLFGIRDLIHKKVRYLVLSGGAYPDGDPESNIKSDVPAATKLFAEWPTPIIASGAEIGSGILYPGATINSKFSYTDRHPIADSYRANKTMPYDAPTCDMSAVLHAIRPKEGYFQVSDPGTITVTGDGSTRFSASAEGRHRYLVLPAGQKQRIINTYVEIASAPPVVRVLTFPKKPQKEEPPKEQPEEKLESAQS